MTIKVTRRDALTRIGVGGLTLAIAALADSEAFAKAVPPWQKLWNAYPTGSADAVKRMIGGHVNQPAINNTCTVRISRAFNYSGQPFP